MSFVSVRLSTAKGAGEGGASSVRFGSGGSSSDMLGKKIKGVGNSKCIQYYTLIYSAVAIDLFYYY